MPLRLFMTLDKEVFGHTKYKLTDSKLFENYFPDSLIGNQSYLEFGTQNGNRNSNSNRTESMSSSITFTIYCSSCVSLYWQIIYYYNLNGIPTWEFTGGGGGGSGNSTPPDCPGIPVSRNQNVTDPCSSGWVPVPPEPTEDPCTTVNNAAKKMDSAYIKCNADSMLTTIPNLATGLLERGFPIYKKFRVNPYNVTDTTIIGYRSGNLQSGTDSNIVIQSAPGYLELLAAALHTHPPTGYSAHSAKDVYELIAEQMQNSQFEGTFVAAANGSQFALTVTDNAASAAFYATMSQNLDGTKWKEDSQIGKAFEKAYDYYSENVYKGNPNKTNLSYQMAMAAVLKQFNTGVTLNKKNTSGNFKPIVVNTVPDPRKPRRTIYTQDCL